MTVLDYSGTAWWKLIINFSYTGVIGGYVEVSLVVFMEEIQGGLSSWQISVEFAM